MSAPDYTDILNPFSYYKNISDEKYYILIKVLDGFFLICINDLECNIYNLFNWIYTEQSKRHKVFMNKPIKCVFNTYYNSKYKSIVSNGGDKTKYILNSVKDFYDYPNPEIEFTKNDIKKIIHNRLSNIEDKIFENYIEEEINIEVFNKLHNEVKVIDLLYHYNFLEFLLTYEVPYVIKDKSVIYIFGKKELNKFLFDYKFLYFSFVKSNVEESLYMLSLFKKYSES